jgi:diguanylate cyclase (GGDEF)-like protein
MLLLPGADLEKGIALAEDARAQIAALGIEHPQTSRRHLTVSFGVASVVPNKESNPDALIARADAALYEAKRRGRNCVVASEE